MPFNLGGPQLVCVLVIVLIMEAVVGEVRREHESIDEQRLRELRE